MYALQFAGSCCDACFALTRSQQPCFVYLRHHMSCALHILDLYTFTSINLFCVHNIHWCGLPFMMLTPGVKWLGHHCQSTPASLRKPALTWRNNSIASILLRPLLPNALHTFGIFIFNSLCSIPLSNKSKGSKAFWGIFWVVFPQ